MGRRAGFTVIETVLAIVIVGMLALIAYPRIGSAVVKTDLQSARTQVVNMLSTARSAATQSSRTAWLNFEGNNVFVTASPRRTVGGSGTLDTVGTVVDLTAVYGAAVTVSGGVTQIQFDPRGFAGGLGGDAVTIQLTRGGYTQTATVDALGRVQQ